MLIDGYVRVSQVRGRKGPSFISPLEQRDQIEAWAQMHGAEVATVFEELDESGTRSDRPLLLEALARIERGESNGLVVARLDRFGRSLVDGLAAIERIRLAGGAFVSVQDGFDIRTPTGKLVLRLMLSMAEFELDRMRANFEAARSRRIARGAHYGPTAPPGYKRTPAGPLAVDEAIAPHITEVFRRRADGHTWRQISAYLREVEVLTGAGNEFWNPSSVYALVRNRVYRGEVRSGAYRNTNAHRPLVDEVTWQLAQRPNTIVRPNETKPALLAGILRCAACRGALSPTRENTRGGHQLYICAKAKAGGRCPAPTSIRSHRIEPFVQLLFFRALTYPPPEVDYRRKQVKYRRKALAGAEQALAAFRDDERIEDVLGRDHFVLGLRVRALRVDDARRALAFAEQAAATPPVPPVAELRREWLDLTVAERRLYIARVIDCVFIRPGRVSVEARCWPLYRGQAPEDLPTHGRRSAPPEPFEPPGQRDWWREHWQPKTWWNDDKIAAELRPILRGRDEWPTQSEFLDAGRSALLDAVYHHGGSIEWARRMGVRPCRGTGSSSGRRTTHPPS